MPYPLLGTKIVLDEEKILREDIYDLEDFKATIDRMAEKCNLTKIDEYTYHSTRDRMALSNIGVFVHCKLVECDWFTKNVKEWVWIDEGEGNKDLIQSFKKRNEGVWNE
ncbi:hypothetical protein CCZ01_09585 [Helicobacter monodelphidis]|uniref:hypothetical protein n=1 Tax=Helicobacter sp. 15-1451 TaxID=2004995 RepID=UPI000DCC65C2|nr:hypothetical protein [Helicobacter sp. 15-1451]RAX56413.1 hypothetical protein CCZ01_09585 [Helicobacter sp. 15-1451]